MAIPVKDVSLLNWSSNANTRLTASPTTYGTTAAVATQYDTLHDAFAAAYADVVAARAAKVRSSPLADIKELKKRELLAFARPLYKQIQANTSVASSAKIELGVVVPNFEPTPVPIPGFAPRLTIVSVNGRLVKILLADPAHPTHKRMPAGCDGATIMSFVGDEAPEDPRAYKYEGSTAKMNVEVLFPESVEAGTKVWLTAFFFNERKQNGPACEAVDTVINYGGSMPMTA